MMHVLGVKMQTDFTCIYTIEYYILTIIRSRDEISCSFGFTLRIVGKATTSISSLTSLGLFCFVCPERQANLRWKDSGVKSQNRDITRSPTLVETFEVSVPRHLLTRS